MSKYLLQFGAENYFHPADKFTQELILREHKAMEKLEMSIIPETSKEFANSKYYCLDSSIRKYQGLLPHAKPLEQTFKGEDIYLRKYVTELHTTERWLKYRRCVKEGEEPVKSVRGMYNDP